jgi:hypothetical protein
MSEMWIKGEGGSVRRYAEPLHATIAERLEKGIITRVNKDGSSYVESAEPAKLTPKQKIQVDARALDLDDSGTVDEITARIDAKVAELLKQAAELGIDADKLTAVELSAAIDAKLAS